MNSEAATLGAASSIAENSDGSVVVVMGLNVESRCFSGSRKAGVDLVFVVGCSRSVCGGWGLMMMIVIS